MADVFVLKWKHFKWNVKASALASFVFFGNCIIWPNKRHTHVDVFVCASVFVSMCVCVCVRMAEWSHCVCIAVECKCCHLSDGSNSLQVVTSLENPHQIPIHSKWLESSHMFHWKSICSQFIPHFLIAWQQIDVIKIGITFCLNGKFAKLNSKWLHFRCGLFQSKSPTYLLSFLVCANWMMIRPCDNRHYFRHWNVVRPALKEYLFYSNSPSLSRTITVCV